VATAQDEESLALGPVPKAITHSLCGLEQSANRPMQLPIKSVGIFPLTPVNTGSGPSIPNSPLIIPTTHLAKLG